MFQERMLNVVGWVVVDGEEVDGEVEGLQVWVVGDQVK